MLLWTGKLADIREAQSYYQAERSDAGSLALLQAEKHRLQVRLFVVSTKHRLPPYNTIFPLYPIKMFICCKRYKKSS